MMLTKSYPVSIKATGESDGLAEGQFTALVSVFNNTDSYGDVVMPGAFTSTLAAWEESGNPIPCYYSHRMDDPDMCIGEVLEASETTEGLMVKVQLDLDDDARKAKQVYRLMKGRRVTQFSFAYDVVDGAPGKRNDEDVFELRELKLYEVGPTPIGANQETELIAIKNAGAVLHAASVAAKAGRILSTKNEQTLRAAHEQLSAAAQQIADVLSHVDGTPDQEKNAQPQQPAAPADLDPVQPTEPPTAEGPADGAKATRLAIALAALSLRDKEYQA